MEALAIIGGIKPRRQQPRGEEMAGFSVSAISGELREKAETRSMLEMIDQELKQFRGVPELDFKAGYLAGRIKEKNMGRLITDAQAEQLTRLLYSKYEVLRNLKGGAGR